MAMEEEEEEQVGGKGLYRARETFAIMEFADNANNLVIQVYDTMIYVCPR
jgi:hypothetical protein